MNLEGQHGERGIAMAALLVSLAVMSVLMSVALPTWRHQAQREKEAELIFRGEQYARAIALYRTKNGNNFPPSVDVLVQGKFLRKKYKDPVTDSDFVVIGAAQGPTTPGMPGQTPGQPSTGRGGGTTSPGASTATPGMAAGGIMGVRSKSEATSIRVYNNQTKYSLWTFTFTTSNRPGGNTPNGGAGVPGGGGRSGTPGTGRGGTATPGRGGPGSPGSTPTGTPPGRGSFSSGSH